MGKQNVLVGLRAWVVVVGCLMVGGMVRGEEAPRPNVVVLVADDLGYADVGFNGGEIRTPNIDRIARDGVALKQFYVQPVCSPTRAALMTGRYPMRHGLQVGVILPFAKHGLPLEERLLPQALKEVGYETAIVGKWHLGHFERAYLPTRRGFDHQYGHYCGQIDYFEHTRAGGFDWHRNDEVCRDEGYSTELIGKEAVRRIKEREKGKPLFLYVPFNAVHSPWQVPDRYKEPYAQMKEPRQTYAGMLAAMDEAIGGILGAIESEGMREKTLVVFMSDNGGPQPGKVTSNGELRSGKGSLYEGGVRVAACASWPGTIAAGGVVDVPLHVVDVYPTVLALAGAKAEQERKVDGVDVRGVIARGETLGERVILHNASPKSGAVRVGDWKLVIHAAGAGEEEDEGQGRAAGRKGRQVEPAKGSEERVQLFNIAEDSGEKRDLAGENPAKVKELRAVYDRLAAEAAEPKYEVAPVGAKAPAVWGEG